MFKRFLIGWLGLSILSGTALLSGETAVRVFRKSVAMNPDKTVFIENTNGSIHIEKE